MNSRAFLTLAAYFIIALGTLIAGITINLMMDRGLGGDSFDYSSFYLLVVEYGILHAGALSVGTVLAWALPRAFRPLLFLCSSSIFLVASTIIFNPSQYHGLHFVIILATSLVLMSIFHFLNRPGSRPTSALAGKDERQGHY